MGAAQVRKAVAGNTVRHAREWLGFSDSQIAAATGAHRRTVQRWVHGAAAPRPQHQAAMEELRELTHLLRVVFADAEAAQGWFHASVPMLRGRTPARVVEDGRADEVIAILSGLASGAHI